jgi:hypothetical protein
LLSPADLALLVGVDAAELPPGVLPPALPLARIGRAPWPAEPRLVADVVGDIALVIEELAPRVKARAAADWDVAGLDRVNVRSPPRPWPQPTGGSCVWRARRRRPGPSPRPTCRSASPGRPSPRAKPSRRSAATHRPATRSSRRWPPSSWIRPAASSPSPRRSGWRPEARRFALAHALALADRGGVLGAGVDEDAFARDFARAFAAGRAAVVGG